MKYHQPFDQPNSPDASYQNANPALGLRGSILDIIAVEQTQREILKVITAAGLTPDDTDLTQLWQAIKSIAGDIATTTVNNTLTTNAVDVNLPFGTAAGTAAAITCDFQPAMSALRNGQLVLMKNGAADNPAGPITLDADTLGATALVRCDGTDLAAGDMPALGMSLIAYDGARAKWVLIYSAPAAAGGGGTSSGQYVTGHIYMWPTEAAPAGTLECNGALVSRTTYAALFAKIGTRYGVGDGVNTFALPDYRGYFVRGWDHGAGHDPDAAERTDRGDGQAGDKIGTKQGGAAGPVSITGASLTINNPKATASSGATDQPIGTGTSADGGNTHTQTVFEQAPNDAQQYWTKITGQMDIVGNSGSTETRPKNINVMFVIAI